jgi:transcription termination/antitermination protein NusG
MPFGATSGEVPMSFELCTGRWIAIQVKAGMERLVAEGLRSRGYNEFLPCYQRRTIRRSEAREQVLFPGYVFCRYLACPRHRIVEIPGVVRLVGLPKLPIPIPDDEIDAIRRVVESGYYSEPWKCLRIGQPVRVLRGPLVGLRGVLVAVRKGARLIIAVSLLKRAVAAEVDAADTEPIDLLPPEQGFLQPDGMLVS